MRLRPARPPNRSLHATLRADELCPSRLTMNLMGAFLEEPFAD
jgi:hypothetical protein